MLPLTPLPGAALLCAIISLLISGVRGIELSTRKAKDNEIPSNSNVTMLASAKNEVDTRCWIFSHLQKCGGSTVKEMIVHRWGEDFQIFDNNHWKRGDAFSARYSEILLSGKRWHVSGGGYTEGLRRHVGDRCTWFTMFRHPVPRLVSAYFYCKGVPTDAACASERVDAKDVDLLTFAKHWGNFALRQFVLSRIDVDDFINDSLAQGFHQRSDGLLQDSGWYMLKKYLKRGIYGSEEEVLPDRALYDMLRPVLELIENNYTAVGLLENFHESLELFNRALGMPALDWHESFSQYSIMKQEKEFAAQEKKVLASAWTNAEIKQYIALDLVLYDHAVAVFNKQKKKYGIL